MVRDEKKVTNIFNDFFVNIVPNLGVNTELHFVDIINISHNLIDNAIYKYKTNPNVIAIKTHMNGTHSSFSFQTVTKENTAKLIKKLNNKKAFQSTDIPITDIPTNPANICLFQINNRNTRKRCEMCSKLTIKTPG